MFDKFVRFTDSARDALNLARNEARRLEHGYVGCEHLILGLMREQMGMAGIILRAIGLDLETVSDLIPPAKKTEIPGRFTSKLDLSPGCKKALNKAIQEAQIHGHPLVSTEHILVGLISQPEGAASKMLLRLGITPQVVDAHIQQVLDDGKSLAVDPDQVDKLEFEDRYRIESVIGVGSMSTVYRARDLQFPNVVKLVAIKEMHVEVADIAARNQLIKSFQHEATILASLKHPFIPRFYEFFSTGERFYIVMEYIVGEDLETIISDTEGFLPLHQILDWGVQLCDVLTYLHTYPSGPVIFRDLKPSNIMVDRHGNVRLIDFNVARVFQLRRRSGGLGTQGYSPPEQYHGVLSPLVDIYALGATMHHLLTKIDPRTEPPFSFDQRLIRRINQSVPHELEAVVYRALAYNSDHRYQSAESMKLALMAVPLP